MRLRGRLPDRSDVVDLTVHGQVIAAIEPAGAQPADLGDEGCVVSGGWLDLQVNGYRGLDLCGSFRAGAPDIAVDTVAQLAALMPAVGAARFLPTVTTNTEPAMAAGLRAVAAACEQSAELAEQMPGVHLEGPFIAPEDGPRGAHPLDGVRDPDWELFERLQEAAGGRLRLLTLAPERPGAIDLIRRAVAAGVTVSLGHCAPSADDIARAVDAGATLSTHLGNGAHAVLPRHPNYLWEQLAEDRLTACVIADLHHLPASVLRCFARVKGPGRLVVVSDVAALGGLPPGLYNDGRHEVLASGRVNLAGTPYLAGAGHCLDTCMANALRVLDWSQAEVLGTVTSNAGAAVGLPVTPAVPRAGDRADLTLFRTPGEVGPVEIVATLCGGRALPLHGAA